MVGAGWIHHFVAQNTARAMPRSALSVLSIPFRQVSPINWGLTFRMGVTNLSACPRTPNTRSKFESGIDGPEYRGIGECYG